MSFRSPVQAAVLGVLVEQPGYGSQIGQRLGRRLGPSWDMGTHVYAALDKLEAAGLIEMVPEEADRPRLPKPLYRATDDGLAALRQWLGGPVRAEPLRAELHVKLMVSRPRDAALLLAILDQFERGCLARIEELRDDEHVALNGWEAEMAALRREAVSAHLRADLVWAQRARERIRTFAERQRS